MTTKSDKKYIRKAYSYTKKGIPAEERVFLWYDEIYVPEQLDSKRGKMSDEQLNMIKERLTRHKGTGSKILAPFKNLISTGGRETGMTLYRGTHDIEVAGMQGVMMEWYRRNDIPFHLFKGQCEICGKALHGNKRKIYCSRECKELARRKKDALKDV